MKIHAVASKWQLPISFGTAEMQPMTFQFKNKQNGRSLFDLELNDKVYMNGWDPTTLNLERNGLIVRDPDNLADFINSMSRWFLSGNMSTTSAPYDLLIDGKGDVLCLGIPVRNVDFHREQSLDILKQYFGIFALI